MPKPAILYHYCSNFAFHSILSQKKIRLSLLTMSNDSKEGQHILDVARRLLPDSFAHKKETLRQLEIAISLVSAVGFCLSEVEDVLSQWRGYADNAQGVAIGFDSSALEVAAKEESESGLILRLSPIAYKDTLLFEVMKPDLQPIIEHYTSGKMDPPRYSGTILTDALTDEERKQEQQRTKEASSELFHKLWRIGNYAYMVKAPFFDEEREWRLVALTPIVNGTLDLPDPEFASSPERLRPFRHFPLKGFAPSLIKEIVLGPRNQTPDEVVRLFLDRHGYEHVTIRRSQGSYR